MPTHNRTTSSPHAVRWGENVSGRRDVLNMTQMTLADECKVAQSTISRCERGVCVPGDWLKVKIAKVLKCPIGDLFGYVEDEGAVA